MVALLLILIIVAAALALAACGGTSATGRTASPPHSVAASSAQSLELELAEPDSLIAFVNVTEGGSDLCVVHPDGTGLRRLTDLVGGSRTGLVARRQADRPDRAAV